MPGPNTVSGISDTALRPSVIRKLLSFISNENLLCSRTMIRNCFGSSSCHVTVSQNYSLSASYSPNRIVPRVTQRSQVTVPPRKSQYRDDNREETPGIVSNEIEDEEEEYMDDGSAPYLIEGDIALPEVTQCTGTAVSKKGELKLFSVQDLDPRSRLAVDFMRQPAKKWPNNTVPYRMSKNYCEI